MNREIKFRARRKLNNDWVYGSYVYQGNDFCRIIPFNVEWYWDDLEEYTVRVITETVGQYTGLKDKHGKEGYHKDILKGFGRLWVIEWQSEEARFLIMPYAGNISNWKFMDELHRMEIIGNVYENPELL